VIEFIVSTVAVQGFYLVDGLLFARRLEGPGIGTSRYVVDSARRLLWPWLLFGIFYIAARYVAELRGLVEPTRLTESGLSLGTIAEMIWWSENAPQLYFLPSLFLIRCAAVARRRLFAAAPPATLILTSIALLLLFRTVIEPAYMRTFTHDGYDPILHALGGLAFFILGAGLWRLRVVESRRGMAAVGIAVALVVLSLVIPPPIDVTAAQLGYLGSVYFLFATGKIKSPLLVAVGRRTMGIYLLHMPVVMKLSSSIAGWLIGPPGLATFAIVVSLSFVIAFVITAAIEGLRLSGIVLGERRIATPPTPAQVH